MTSEAARIEHWDYKLEGRDAFRDAKPNAVHHAIVRLERAGKLRAVVTQNIDGLHSLAGTSPERLVELHGTNALVECQTCHRREDPEEHFEYFRLNRRPPLCACGGFLKPATISFGQNLDARELERAHQFAMEADLVVACGSGRAFGLSGRVPLSLQARAFLISSSIAERPITIMSAALPFDWKAKSASSFPRLSTRRWNNRYPARPNENKPCMPSHKYSHNEIAL